jgi:MFS superfamily sulfate permease-like transporter
MTKFLKEDLISGFVISLVALPLSIGIALASGVPVSAGVLAAIIAGLVGSLVSGVQIGISGPGAGMIVVVATGVQTLGNGDILLGFQRTIACVLVVGILQILTGVFKLGRFTKLCPSPVVKGMLCAIGAIIIVKQLPVLLGIELGSQSISYFVSHFINYVPSMNVPVSIIGLLSVLILMLWVRIPKKISKTIPGTLVVVVMGVFAAKFLDLGTNESANFFGAHYESGPKFFVNIPKSFSQLFIFPVFDSIVTVASISTILSIYVVSSLESFLCAIAVEDLDPLKRKSNLNKDIIGKGLANMTCGLLGGFPVILAIVRTTANIQSGGKTIKANFFHGCFILIFVVFFSSAINQVPLAVLAAILILVGYSLLHPHNFVSVWRTGKVNFFLFLVTLVVTVMVNLLAGIIVGIVSKVIINFIQVQFLHEVPLMTENEFTDELE